MLTQLLMVTQLAVLTQLAPLTQRVFGGCLQVAVEEMRRLQRYGLTASELERYIQSTMKDRWVG